MLLFHNLGEIEIVNCRLFSELIQVHHVNLFSELMQVHNVNVYKIEIIGYSDTQSGQVKMKN